MKRGDDEKDAVEEEEEEEEEDIVVYGDVFDDVLHFSCSFLILLCQGRPST
jgi:hypothetical protein